jgi:DNA modification methylase
MVEEDSDVLKHPLPDQKAFLEINKADAGDLSELIESDESILKEDSVDFIITSPPYWQKRDYGVEDQIGQEETPEEFIDTMVECLSEWRKVLKPSGSIFVNIGDTYEKRSLVGIPEMLMQAANEDGWLIRNKILWAKPGGMPDPAKNRLVTRHEYIFHFTQNNGYYYDLFGYSNKYGNGSNPGDFWDLKHAKQELGDFSAMPEDIVEQLNRGDLEDLVNYFYGPNAGDVWKIGHDRNTGSHLAPFPEELVERALLMGCPPATCSECGEPLIRDLKRTTELDESRPQAKRAMEIYAQSDLTTEHIRAVQAVGISDAGKAMEIQDGTGRNADDVQELADQAKEVLGGYFREFTFPNKETDGWSGCNCGAETKPGVVFDPFMGSGTTLEVAARMGYSSVGVDLNPPSDFQLPLSAKKVESNI